MGYMALREYMAKRGLTQQELADRLGVEQYTISRWCKRGVPPKHIRRVARVTGISVQRLLPVEVAA
jgi:transcriptional regulator with XRE-family HTH domain